MTDRKKRIFNWNQISDKLKKDQVDELKSYYKTYHRKCWVYKKAFKHFKIIKIIGDSISVVLATGGIATAIGTHGITLAAISTGAVLIQGYMKHKNLDLKIQNCQYAYQSYQHLLISIKNSLRSGYFEQSQLYNMMRGIDDFVTDNSPVVDKFITKYNKKFID